MTNRILLPTIGTVLQVMPATGTVSFEGSFEGKAEVWSLPLVGYAVVVRWVSIDEPVDDVDDLDPGVIRYETKIEPVILDGGFPILLRSDYFADGSQPWPRWTVRPGP